MGVVYLPGARLRWHMAIKCREHDDCLVEFRMTKTDKKSGKKVRRENGRPWPIHVPSK